MDDARRTYHRLKLQTRRKLRRQKRHVEDITVQADDSLNKHFFRRFNRLYAVRRFVFTWTALLVFVGLGSVWQVRGLDAFYLQLTPVSGGIYREGILGAFTTANPLFAVSSADASVSRLVFSGLFRISPSGKLEPDLASAYTTSDDDLTYTVSLRDDVFWHDGTRFSADDVIFTYELIKNPEVRSPLRSGWSSVNVQKIDDRTVSFTLPNTLSSFHFSLVNGIVPKHVLEDVSSADLRSSAFNTVSPVGTGPFIYKDVEVLGDKVEERRERISLTTNRSYYRSPAKVDGISIRTYRDEDSMLKAFDNKEISTMVGLQTISDRLQEDTTVKTFSTPLSSQVMVFFNNSNVALSEVKVRQALLRATDTKQLRQSIGYQLIESDGPFLKSHFTYKQEKRQATKDLVEAERLLDEAGWLKDEKGLRRKENIPLKLRLISQSLTEYSTVVRGIQQQWSEIGVEVEAILQPEEDVQSVAIAQHDYDVLLYGISIGPDPDVFAYWHSSQADERLRTRLNLSEYKSTVADTALEGGRTRFDEALRIAKYDPFVDAWLVDTPAIALYQPRFLFVVRGTLEGYRTGEFVSATDRFYSVTDWQVRRERTIK